MGDRRHAMIGFRMGSARPMSDGCYKIEHKDDHYSIILNLEQLDEKMGRDVLNAFCRCFVHSDRLTSAISCKYTSEQYHGADTAAYERDLNAMVWFAIGSFRELSHAIRALRSALAKRGLLDPECDPWIKLRDFEQRWQKRPFLRKMRNSGAFHVGEDVIDAGLDELVKQRHVTLAEVGRTRVESRLWLGCLALHNGLGLTRESYGELLDIVMADHEVVADTIHNAFVLATKAAGIPFCSD